MSLQLQQSSIYHIWQIPFRPYESRSSTLSHQEQRKRWGFVHVLQKANYVRSIFFSFSQQCIMGCGEQLLSIFFRFDNCLNLKDESLFHVLISELHWDYNKKRKKTKQRIIGYIGNRGSWLTPQGLIFASLHHVKSLCVSAGKGSVLHQENNSIDTGQVDIGKIVGQGVPPGVFWRSQLNLEQPRFLKFNISVQKNALIGVYGRKGLAPSHTQVG